MRIGLCDDDQSDLNRLKAELARYVSERNLKVEFEAFSRPALLVKAAEEKPFDILLLDMIMPDMDGLEVAERLGGVFVFLTSSTDCAISAFACGAVHYLVKPYESTDFNIALDRAIAALPKKKIATIELKADQGTRLMPLAEIAAAETDGHQLNLFFVDGSTWSQRMSGREFWTRVEPTGQFARVGAGLFLNLAAVTTIGIETKLRGGHKVTVPRRALDALQETYALFCCS